MASCILKGGATHNKQKMESLLVLLCLAAAASVLMSSGEGGAASVRVGSFNPDVFGKTKFSKDHIMTTFSQVSQSVSPQNVS